MRYPTNDEHDPEFTHDDLTDEEIDNADFADRMDLEKDDQFLTDQGHARDVVTVSSHRDLITVTSPFHAHPQAAMSGNWQTSLRELYVEWRQGKIEPANLTIEAETPSEDAAFAFDPNVALQRMEAEADNQSEFLEDTEDLVTTHYEQAAIEYGCEYVQVCFPAAEEGGEPAVKASFSVTDKGDVCKNGLVVVQYETDDGEWRREEAEMLAKDGLGDALEAVLPSEPEAQPA